MIKYQLLVQGPDNLTCFIYNREADAPVDWCEVE